MDENSHKQILRDISAGEPAVSAVLASPLALKRFPSGGRWTVEQPGRDCSDADSSTELSPKTHKRDDRGARSWI